MSKNINKRDIISDIADEYVKEEFDKLNKENGECQHTMVWNWNIQDYVCSKCEKTMYGLTRNL